VGAATGFPGYHPAATGDFPYFREICGYSPTPRALSPDVQPLGWLGLLCCIPPSAFLQDSALPKTSLLARHNPVTSQLLNMDESQQGAERVEDFNTYPSLTATERESSLVVDITLL